jgi:hypothetical protein
LLGSPLTVSNLVCLGKGLKISFLSMFSDDVDVVQQTPA